MNGICQLFFYDIDRKCLLGSLLEASTGERSWVSFDVIERLLTWLLGSRYG
jgi:hypothetical protein